MKMKKVCAIVLGIIVLAIVVVVLLQSCSISKKVDNTKEQNVVSQTEQGIQVIPEETEVVATEVVTSTPEVTFVPTEVPTEEVEITDLNIETAVPTEEIDVDTTEDSVKEIIGDLDLGSEKEVVVLVSSKKVYSFETSYVYSLDLLMPSDVDEEYRVISYFCPKTTFDAVEKNDALVVKYQEDEDGKVSISTVSKKE